MVLLISLANFCSSNFHNLLRLLLLPPPSAVINSSYDHIKAVPIAKILENRIYDKAVLFSPTQDSDLLALAEHYYQKYLQKYEDKDTADYFSKPPSPQTADFEAINVLGLDLQNSRSLGTERLCHEVLKQIGLADFLARIAFTSLQIDHAMISIIARAIFVSSEHKTAQYLQTNSALNELFDKDFDAISRHHLYAASDNLYEHKSWILTNIYTSDLLTCST